MKRLLGIILTIVAATMVLSMSASAAQQESLPQYNDTTPSFATVEDAADYVLQCYKQRMETVQYFLPVEIGRYDFMDVVFRHTGIPDEGDYLKRLYQLGGDFRDTYEEGDSFLYIHTFYDYVITAEQEAAVAKKAKKIIASLNLDGKTEYEKIKAVADYICDNVSYDYDFASDSYIGYGAFINGKAVCDGYSQMTYRLMLEAGIDCRYISGYTPNGAHAWNIVKLGSKYYYIDTTWMDTAGDGWFLRGSEDFYDHTPQDIYTAAEFSKQYPMAKTAYIPGTAAPKISATVKTATGRPKISWNRIEQVKEYHIYRSTTGKTGSFVKYAATTATSYTDTKATAGTKYYYKVRPVSTGGTKGELSKSVGITAINAVPNLKGSYIVATGKPKLTWNAVTNAVKYEIYRSTTGKTGSFVKTYTTTATSYTNTGAKAGTTYYYKVRAVFSNGVKSNLSSPVTVKCRYPVPTAKAQLSSAGKPKITWNAVTNAAKYEVFRSTTGKDGSFVKTFTTTSTSYTNTGAKKGIKYYYKVRAVFNNGVVGNLSSPVSITATK